MIKALVLTLLLVLSFASNGYAQLKRYDVLSYSGTIELDRQDTFIRGHVKMNAVCTTGAPVDKIIQHLIYLEIDSVLVNGERATIDWTGKDSGEYYVVPPASMLIPGFFIVETFYHGKPLPEQTSNKWGGVSNRGGMMFAMGVGFKVPYISCTRHWLPCYDLPDDKADSARIIFVSKDPNDVVAGSGQLERVFDTLGGRAYDWNMVNPIASYLMTFAQGRFELMEIENPLNVPFEAYAFVADTAKMRRVMERRVVRGLEFFDSLFTPYPLEKLGYVVAPIGSMEHQTMITLDRGVLDTNSTTALHELSHMWFGDMVTCHTFDDPWLNEGFATFSESLYLERFEGRQAYHKRQLEKIKTTKAKGSDYPMYGAPYWNEHKSNYPEPVLYAKGAAVLGMLRYFVGDEKFFSALRSYLNKYAYKTATSYDLWRHFEVATDQDLDWFFQKWVFEKGYPSVGVTFSPKQPTTIWLNQTSTSGYFKLPVVVEATSETQQTSRRTVWMDSMGVTVAEVDFGFVPVSLKMDPDSVLIAEFGPVTSFVGGSRGESFMPLVTLPNPATSILTISGLLDSHIGGEVTLVDTGGSSKVIGVVRQAGNLELNVRELSAGSYRLVIRKGDKIIHSEQVIVQR
jgi:aminopeptidase N